MSDYNPSAIKATWKQTMEALEDTFAKWGVKEWQVRPIREPDKRPHQTPWSEPATVTLEFVLRKRSINLSMGEHPYYYQNLRIIYLGVEAMRMNEVRGLDKIITEAVLQLAAPPAARDPYEVVGVMRGASLEEAELMWKSRAKRLHPDLPGGSHEAMKELNDAMDRIRAELSGAA